MVSEPGLWGHFALAQVHSQEAVSVAAAEPPPEEPAPGAAGSLAQTSAVAPSTVRRECSGPAVDRYGAEHFVVLGWVAWNSIARTTHRQSQVPPAPRTRPRRFG